MWIEGLNDTGYPLTALNYCIYLPRMNVSVISHLLSAACKLTSGPLHVPLWNTS